VIDLVDITSLLNSATLNLVLGMGIAGVVGVLKKSPKNQYSMKSTSRLNIREKLQSVRELFEKGYITPKQYMALTIKYNTSNGDKKN